MARLLALAICYLVALPMAGGRAEPLPEPHGPVVLTVDGRISNTNRDGAADFDIALLKRFGGATMTTETPWADGQITFEGISGPQLLELLGAQGEAVTAVALNDYQVEIPIADFRKPDLLLIAYLRDGEAMSVRDKGPLWIVFPFSARPDLDPVTYQSRSIWQLRSLTFR